MDLLGRARKMMKGLGPAEPPRPQYYDVACAEGHPLQGARTESYQALRCPVCGRGIFVLPRSPLPEPPAPKARREVAPEADAESTPLDDAPIALSDPEPPAEDEPEGAPVEWIDDEAEAGPPADDGFDAIIPEREAPGPRRPSRGARPVGPAAGPVEAASGRPAILIPDRPRRRRGPIWIAAGVALLVAATVAYRGYKIQLQNLPQRAEEAMAAGKAALEAGDFTNAKFRFGEAAAALKRLGAGDAATVQQAADEAAIFADLKSPEELVDEAARARSPEDWAARFEKLYKGQSILVEDELAEPTPGSKAPFELHYLILAGDKPSVGYVDLAGLALFRGTAFKVGTRVTFGARLASITLESGGRWRVALQPDSGVIITDHRPLSFLGWNPAEPGPAVAGAGAGGGP